MHTARAIRTTLAGERPGTVRRAAAAIEYRILGPLEVRAGGALVPLGGPRQRALLAVLLLNANRVVARDALRELLWTEPPADHTLRVSVSRLRHALAGAGPVLRAHARGYVLHVAPGELDRDRFERLIADARASRDVAEVAATLHEAEGLWHGRALAEFEDTSFARAETERLEELRTAAIEERVDAELALGRHATLVPELAAAVTQHPLRERLRAQLMVALYRCGRQADALVAYGEGRTHLVAELGLEPVPALVRLQTAILRQDPALELDAVLDAGGTAREPRSATIGPTGIVSRV